MATKSRVLNHDVHSWVEPLRKEQASDVLFQVGGTYLIGDVVFGQTTWEILLFVFVFKSKSPPLEVLSLLESNRELL